MTINYYRNNDFSRETGMFSFKENTWIEAIKETKGLILEALMCGQELKLTAVNQFDKSQTIGVSEFVTGLDGVKTKQSYNWVANRNVSYPIVTARKPEKKRQEVERIISLLIDELKKHYSVEIDTVAVFVKADCFDDLIDTSLSNFKL